MAQTLGEMGERRIAGEILPRFAAAIGDDCALVPIPRGDWDLAVTTDPVPPLAARAIGRDDDLYWMGGWPS